MIDRQAHRRDIEPWFVRHGLPYFVASERAQAREGLRPRRLVPVMVLVALAAVAAAVALTWVTSEASFAPATLTFLAVLAAAFYALTALRARPILGWALRRTRNSLLTLVPMVARALPLLLLIVTFLFINAEAWELSAGLDGSLLWLTVLLFSGIAVVFLLVRLPEEVDRVDDFIDAELVLRATRGTPIEQPVQELVEERGEEIAWHDYGDVPGFERWNLILVLLITQVAQVLLLSMAVLVFFLVFGGIVMDAGIQESWTAGRVHHLPWLQNLSVELVQVSVFLAAFSGLNFAVAVMTDENYKEQFFHEVIGELERAVGVRAGYLALRDAGAADTATAPVDPAPPGG